MNLQPMNTLRLNFILNYFRNNNIKYYLLILLQRLTMQPLQNGERLETGYIL